jgi:hypothetical protein
MVHESGIVNACCKHCTQSTAIAEQPHPRTIAKQLCTRQASGTMTTSRNDWESYPHPPRSKDDQGGKRMPRSSPNRKRECEIQLVEFTNCRWISQCDIVGLCGASGGLPTTSAKAARGGPCRRREVHLGFHISIGEDMDEPAAWAP